MKDLKRAYRRQKKETLLKKRAKRNYYWLGQRHGSWAKFWEEVKAGKKYTNFRNTGVLCSCYSCSGHYKYKRTKKFIILKNGMEDLRNELNKITGKTKPIEYQCIIAKSECGIVHIIKSNPPIGQNYEFMLDIMNHGHL